MEKIPVCFKQVMESLIENKIPVYLFYTINIYFEFFFGLIKSGEYKFSFKNCYVYR